MILVVDNHGFTTRILTHQLGAVHIITATELAEVKLDDYSHLVIGHGPAKADLELLKSVPNLPMLAIGAGYQHLAETYGHRTTSSVQPIYGQPVTHNHSSTGIFAGVPNPVELISYHPWRLASMAPMDFSIHAVDDNDDVLAFRVQGTHHWGIHADPAALQSTAGATLIENFLALAPKRADTAKEPMVARTTDQPVSVFTRQLPGELDTASTFINLQGKASAAFWLDSASAHLGQGNISLLGTNLGPLAQTIRWDVETHQLDVHTDDTVHSLNVDVLEYLTDHSWQPAHVPNFPGFTGGWVGYLGYEAKQATLAGHRNTWRASTPDAYWIRPQSFIVYDHHKQRTVLFAYQDASLLDDIESTLVFGPTLDTAPAERGSIEGRWRLSAKEYQQAVARIQTQLNSGAAAGICLTDTFTMAVDDLDGLQLYLRLRSCNPAPYAGYLRFNTFDDNLEILAASPEKYLSVDAEGTMETKPIKGTVARSQDPYLDDEVAKKLARDPKTQSENLMIADLLRDDLAPVTVPGTVQVPKLMAVESFATVHQLVTTVTGQLLPGTPVTQALAAVFPGGSMTGAPKLASLAVLEDLEAGPRGVYSGALGWIGGNNAAELSVVIRTIVLDDGHLSIGAGGAVVVDSDPAAENQEKHLKAQALIDCIAEQCK